MSIWDDWYKEQKRKKQALAVVTIKYQKAKRRTMTEAEKRMALTLDKCRLRRPGSHQRMVESLVSAAKADTEISERQAWTLAGLYWMYRAQHGDKSAKKPEGWR